MRRDRARQLQGTFDKLWEKKRKKRKRRPGAGVRHRKREPVNARTPCHVTVKLLDCFESLRRPGPMAVIEEVLRAARERPGRLEDGEFRIVQVSVEIEHLHLLVEAKDELSLSRGMQGFAISALEHVAVGATRRRIVASFSGGTQRGL